MSAAAFFDGRDPSRPPSRWGPPRLGFAALPPTDAELLAPPVVNLSDAHSAAEQKAAHQPGGVSAPGGIVGSYPPGAVQSLLAQ